MAKPPWSAWFGMTTQCAVTLATDADPASATMPDVHEAAAVAETIAWTAKPNATVPTRTTTARYHGFISAMNRTIAP